MRPNNFIRYREDRDITLRIIPRYIGRTSRALARASRDDIPFLPLPVAKLVRCSITRVRNRTMLRTMQAAILALAAKDFDSICTRFAKKIVNCLRYSFVFYQTGSTVMELCAATRHEKRIPDGRIKECFEEYKLQDEVDALKTAFGIRDDSFDSTFERDRSVKPRMKNVDTTGVSWDFPLTKFDRTNLAAGI